MFVINPAPTFNVTVRISTGDTTAALGLCCRHLGRRDYRAWNAKAAAITAIPDAEQRDAADAAWLAEVVVGWGAADYPVMADGTAIPYSPAALAQLLDAYPSASAAVYQAYSRALFEARLGN